MNRSAAAALLALVLAACQPAAIETPVKAEPAQPAMPTLAGPDLKAFIAGRSLRYQYYGAVSTYLADGTYRYRDYEVRDSGVWSIAGDAVCITFADGGRRCDRYAMVGRDYFRIEEGGRQTKVDGVGPA